MLRGLSGGTYRPLTEQDIRMIHQTSLKVLKDIGIEVNHQTALSIFKKKGAKVSDNIVKFPPDLVMETIKLAPNKVLLSGRDKLHDLCLEDKKVYLGTGGTALNMLDLETGLKRLSTLQDVKDMAKVVDALPNIHFYMLPVYPNEIPKEKVDVNRFFAGISNTTKHIMGGVYTKEGVRDVIRMAEIIAGGADELRRRPFISMVTCIISPLRLDATYTDLLIEVARQQIPLVTPAEPLCGASAPITLAGNLVLQNAETLSGIMLAQMVNPGTPVLYGCISSIVDLHSMRYLSGAVEMGLLNAAAAQMAQFYNLPIYATAGMSDAKVPDVQAGYEKMAQAVITALAGANYIHDAAGFLEFCMTASLEQLVIDNEILGMVMRAVKGIKVNENTLAYEVIKEVGAGGHFMAEKHTVRHMRDEFFIPQLSDRAIREEWEKEGSKDTSERAKEKVKEILRTHKTKELDEETIAQIKKEIPGIVFN